MLQPALPPRPWRPLALAAVLILAGCSLDGSAAPDTPPTYARPVPVVTSIVGTVPPSTTTAPATTTTEPPSTTTTTTIAAGEAPPPPLPDPPSPSGGRVLVVGDSVMVAARSQLPAALPAAEVTVDANENRMVTALAGVLAANGAPGPYRAVAIQLCNNYSRGMAYGRYIDQAMATLAGVPRVVWVTCSEWSDGQPEANQAIRAAAGRYPNVAVADWAAVSATPGYTYADGIHLRPPGAVAAAQVVAAAVG